MPQLEAARHGEPAHDGRLDSHERQTGEQQHFAVDPFRQRPGERAEQRARHHGGEHHRCHQERRMSLLLGVDADNQKLGPVHGAAEDAGAPDGDEIAAGE